MTDKTQSQQAVYGSSDVADMLDIQDSTLRKYCLILEDNSYEILRNEHGHRAFFDRDLIVIRKFLRYKDEADMTLEQAAKAVVTWSKGSGVTEVVTEDERYISRYNDLVREFQDFKQDQEDFNKQLLNQLNKQSEYINTRLEQRDQALMSVLRESLESPKQIAATIEKEKKWWKFWQ